MSTGFQFDYELFFASSYDLSVLQSYSTPDSADPSFHEVIESTVNSIKNVLSIQPNVSNMSTYVNYNGSRYKINFSM
jgi:hypothetical protein